MKNPNLGVLLRYYRKGAKLSVNDVVEKLKTEYNTTITNKAVYSWETGQNQPPADTLLRLCKMYHIDNIMVSLGYADSEDTAEATKMEHTFQLSKDEQELIEKYRSHDIFRTAVDKLLELE